MTRIRSGTNFKGTNETTATEMAVTDELAGMLKALLDNRKAELREER